MRGRAGGKYGALIAVCGKIGNRLRNAYDIGRNKYPRLIGQYGVGYAADGGGDARQAGGCGLEIDQSKSLDPAG